MTETTISMPTSVPAPPSLRLRHAGRAIAATLALVAIADVLLFGHDLGLSLPLLVAAIAVSIVLTATKPITYKSAVVAVGLTLAAALPLLEAPSLIGMFCALLALSVLALTLSGRLPARLTTLPWKLFGFALLASFRWLEDGVELLGNQSGSGIGRRIIRQIVIWLVPVGCAVVFVWLFSSANPVIETVLAKIDPSFLAQFANPERIVLWMVVAVVVWPLLIPRLFQKRSFKAAAAGVGATPGRESLLFGPAAILRSLIVFNAIFAIQTALDLTYLWGGVALPEGMTFADYAHRGAYPLIATALLAGAFVLAAMRPGGAGEQNRTIRWLVYAWIAQNIMLCVSSLLRLDLYVDVYSLTELRIAAGIWMALVAIGLSLILARIALRRNNTWLVAANCVALVGTLYVCAFVDFSAVIADFNVSHSEEMGGEGGELDPVYLLNLGPTALPALDRFIANVKPNPLIPPSGDSIDYTDYAASIAPSFRIDMVQAFHERDTDWRAWSFRNWRLERYLAAPAIAVSPRSDNNSGDTSR
ncbi:MAG: DUF4173 domain-containing protein [Devosia sp.]